MRKKITGPTSQQLIDSFPDPFVIIDRDYTIVTANKRYAQHYRADPAQLAGKRCHEISHQLDRPCSEHGEYCPLEELFRTGESTQVMHVHFDAQGNEEQVQINATPLFDEQGEMQFMGESIIPTRNPGTDEFLVGQAGSMQLMVKQVQRAAPTKTTMLLIGESGTGKECLARYIHQHSTRAGDPLVVFDCAATVGSEEIDQKLFGAVDPATGKSIVKGVFQQASGGTLFIDDICELPLNSQLKLLRVLECGEIQPLGGNNYRNVDVRVIVASHEDLRAHVESGKLRKDLFYRLSAFPVQVPPLRERRKDIIALARYFLKMFQPDLALRRISSEVREELLAYEYPGNVRELRNLMERIVIYAAGAVIKPEHLVFDHQLLAVDADAQQNAATACDEATQRLLARRGKGPSDSEILDILRMRGGHRAQAAEELGISERTLYRHLKRLRGV